MKEKVLTAIWSASLMLISLSAVLTAGANLLGYSLPDVLLRMLGAVQLLSVAALGYSTVRKFMPKKDTIHEN